MPHGPLLVRFTNDNINMLKKKRKKFNSHLKRIARKKKWGGGFPMGHRSNKILEVSVMRFGKCVQCLGAWDLLVRETVLEMDNVSGVKRSCPEPSQPVI